MCIRMSIISIFVLDNPSCKYHYHQPGQGTARKAEQRSNQGTRINDSISYCNILGTSMAFSLVLFINLSMELVVVRECICLQCFHLPGFNQTHMLKTSRDLTANDIPIIYNSSLCIISSSDTSNFSSSFKKSNAATAFPSHALSSAKNAKCPPTTGLALNSMPGNPPVPSVSYKSVSGLSVIMLDLGMICLPIQNYIPVVVSLTHNAIESTISSRTFLLATDTAKNCQSLLV